ncbi:MAG: DUF4276 family protein [Chloroflexi bacterium]|nr:DUF4276 family protein [Chloroflexota bacterium]
MNRVVAVVEGVTEQTFIKTVLAPQLALQDVMITARLVGKPGRKGGVGEFSRARRDIVAVLRQDTAVFCTTMFDYYGMPTSWPQRGLASDAPFKNRARLVEEAILQDIFQEMGNGFLSRRFIPYIQMHEFEALLFSDPDTLAQTMQQPLMAASLREIEAGFGSPEMINDHVETAPSKRLIKLFPSYNKVVDGALAAQHITLSKMRQKCLHFAAWLTKLEELGGR